MLENIISLVKDKVGDMIGKEADIPEEKKGEAVQATTASLIDGLKDYATPENITSFASLLGTGGAHSEDSSAIRQSNITQGLQSNVISSLTSKVGLDKGSASKIALLVVPAVIALFSHKANDRSDSGFNISSIVNAFKGASGRSASSGGGESIMEKVGSFFGK
ncbi:MAG: hypothetical protein LIO77_05815 [Rikenellaceae bacterium]|nr:hypothetical protein [Rikenellaceae bacterium]